MLVGSSAPEPLGTSRVAKPCTQHRNRSREQSFRESHRSLRLDGNQRLHMPVMMELGFLADCNSAAIGTGKFDSSYRHVAYRLK